MVRVRDSSAADIRYGFPAIILPSYAVYDTGGLIERGKGGLAETSG